MAKGQTGSGRPDSVCPFFLIRFNPLFHHLPLASPEFWRNAEIRIRRFQDSGRRYNNPNVLPASFRWPITCVKLIPALDFNVLCPIAPTDILSQKPRPIAFEALYRLLSTERK